MYERTFIHSVPAVLTGIGLGLAIIGFALAVSCTANVPGPSDTDLSAEALQTELDHLADETGERYRGAIASLGTEVSSNQSPFPGVQAIVVGNNDVIIGRDPTNCD